MAEYLYSYLNKICSHADILSLARCVNFSRLSFDKRMRYFSVRHSIQFLDPGSQDFALSSIFYSRDVSVFACLFSHTKLDSSVEFFLLSYLNNFLSLNNLSLKVF